MHKPTKQKRREQGLCAHCGLVPSKNYRCESCRELRRKYVYAKSKSPKPKRVFPEVDKAEFIRLAEKKMTRHALAKHFGISKNRAERLVYELDLLHCVPFITRFISKGKSAEVLQEPTKYPTPTGAIPGSKQKVEVLRARVEAGEYLHHPLDADHQGYRPAIENFQFGAIKKA